MARSYGFEEFELEVVGMMSEAAKSKMLAEFAAQQIAETKAANKRALGVESPVHVKVDGIEGRPLSAVRPDGEITAEFDLLGDALIWIHNALVNNSPVLTGQYYESHILMVDGVERDPSKSVPFAEEYVFINTQPYARKIERGLSKQTPNGVYDVVATMAARRLGNVAKVYFGYRSLLGTSALNTWAENTGLQKKGRRVMSMAERDEWLRRQPAIIVRTR